MMISYRQAEPQPQNYGHTTQNIRQWDEEEEPIVPDKDIPLKRLVTKASISYRQADIFKRMQHKMTMDVSPHSITLTFNSIDDAVQTIKYIAESCNIGFAMLGDRTYRHHSDNTDRVYNNILNAMKFNAIEPEQSPRSPSIFTFNLTDNFLHKGEQHE